MLPTPEAVLYERSLLSENKTDVQGLTGIVNGDAAGACDVLRLAARKAVGCGFDAAYEAEPSLILSPDCKSLAVKEPCSRSLCLLSANNGLAEVQSTFVPLPVARDGEVSADVVLSCSWSCDSRLLLVACKSSAVYLLDSSGSLIRHWDPSWPWAQLQLVAACHGPGSTVLLLTAARVLYLVGCSTSSSSGSTDSDGGGSVQQQLLLEKYSVKRCHSSVGTIAYSEKAQLVIIAGDGQATNTTSSSTSSTSSTSHTESHDSSSSAIC